jgi:hypothetical protein
MKALILGLIGLGLVTANSCGGNCPSVTVDKLKECKILQHGVQSIIGINHAASV